MGSHDTSKGLVDAVRRTAHFQVRPHPPVDLWHLTQPTFLHHLLKVSVVAAVQPDAQKDDRRLEMAPLERRGILHN